MTETAGLDVLRNSTQWKAIVRGTRLVMIAPVLGAISVPLRGSATTIGTTLLIIAAIVWLSGTVLFFVSFIPAYRALSHPRPTFWKIRWAVIKDAVALTSQRGDKKGKI